MKQIDGWAAKKCGVYDQRYDFDDACNYFSIGDRNYAFYWTLGDARCRELFRQWWLQQRSGFRRVLFDGTTVLYLEYLSDTKAAIQEETEFECICVMHKDDTK